MAFLFLFDEFSHLYSRFTRHPQKIHSAGQGSYINGSDCFGYFLLQELLTADV
jgi:hypothetical protein